MNLCLRTNGRKKCVEIAEQVINVLSTLLTHPNHEVRNIESINPTHLYRQKVAIVHEAFLSFMIFSLSYDLNMLM